MFIKCSSPNNQNTITKENKIALQHQRDNTKPSPTHHQKHHSTINKHHRDFTEHARDVTNTSKHLKHHPTTYEPQLHWFAQRCTIYKFKLEFEILVRNPIKMFINVHQKIKTPSPKKKNTATSTTQQLNHHKHHRTITTHCGDFTETCPRRHQHITERSPKHHQKNNTSTPKQHRDITKKRQRQDRDITETSPKQHRDITETPPKRHWDITETSQQSMTKTRPRHHHDTTETNTETSPKHHRDIPETSVYISKASRTQDRDITMTPRDITQATQNQDRHITETRPRAWFFQSWSFLRRHTGRSYTGLPKGAQYTNSNRNLRFCLETRSKCSSMFITKQSKHHHQRKTNSTATSTRQHQAITHSSSKHHSTINKHHRDFTEHARDVTNTSKHLKHHPTTYEPQLHWFAQRCTIYKFKLEFEILVRNPIKMFINVHQKIKTPSPKKKTLQHQRHNS